MYIYIYIYSESRNLTCVSNEIQEEINYFYFARVVNSVNLFEFN